MAMLPGALLPAVPAVELLAPAAPDADEPVAPGVLEPGVPLVLPVLAAEPEAPDPIRAFVNMN